MNMKRCLGLLAGLVILGLAGCRDSGETAVASAPDALREVMPAPAMQVAEGAAGDIAQPAQPRYLAERQYWVFELPEARIEQRWQAHVALCRQDCEVLNASISKSRQAPVSASLQLRVGRASAERLFAAMSGPEVSERRVEREDKTLQVVDVEARQKNQAELRDRLRKLLANYKGGLKDVLETERELARVQGDLDALAAQRQVLANETEKVLLNAEYRPEPSIVETGALQPLVEAWRNMGRSFAESLAQALMFIVTALPWLFLVVPVVWGGWKLVRRLFSWRRAGKTPGP
jgi:hypothetical protein